MQALRLAGLRFNKQILKNRKGTAIAVPFLFLVTRTGIEPMFPA